MASPSEHRLGPHGPSEHRAAAPPGPPAFADRTEAGVLLGAALREALRRSAPGNSERLRAGPGRAASPGEADGAPPRVFALPRGGVPVGAGAARALNASLDVLMVRKIGHPEEPELGLGAIAEDGRGGAAEPFFDPEMLRRVGLAREDLAEVVARERAELARRVAVYRRPAAAGDAGPVRAADLTGRLVVVVDDGLATGVTARAALRAVRARGAARTVLAVPVAARAAAAAVQDETDEVVTLVTPRRFRSVGEWYADFGQLTDADVLAMLSSSGQTATAGGTPPEPPAARAAGTDR
jgi:putative phosphoribosyl transferase